MRCPMHIIPTGMEMERFAGGDGARFRAQLRYCAATTPTLVHVGRIAHEKNIDFLLRMFAQRRAGRRAEAVLIVAGEGPALESLQVVRRRRSARRPACASWAICRATKELLDCYRAGDLFVFSSKTETQGLVLLEAMALGVPVVSTAYMGTADIVNPQRGARRRAGR